MLKFSDIDECISNPCDTNANCENVIGSYNCKCKGGFTAEGTSCKGYYIIMYNIVKYNCWRCAGFSNYILSHETSNIICLFIKRIIFYLFWTGG